MTMSLNLRFVVPHLQLDLSTLQDQTYRMKSPPFTALLSNSASRQLVVLLALQCIRHVPYTAVSMTV